MVVSPCYVLLVFCEQGDKGAGQLHVMGSQDLRIGADTAPLFIFDGRINHPHISHVMRRRFQTKERHTDCTCRTIFGRRNRYASAVRTSSGTPAVTDNTHNNPKLRLRRAVPFRAAGGVPTRIIERARLPLLGICPQGRSGARAFFKSQTTNKTDAYEDASRLGEHSRQKQT